MSMQLWAFAILLIMYQEQENTGKLFMTSFVAVDDHKSF